MLEVLTKGRAASLLRKIASHSVHGVAVDILDADWGLD